MIIIVLLIWWVNLLCHHSGIPWWSFAGFTHYKRPSLNLVFVVLVMECTLPEWGMHYHTSGRGRSSRGKDSGEGVLSPASGGRGGSGTRSSSREGEKLAAAVGGSGRADPLASGGEVDKGRPSTPATGRQWRGWSTRLDEGKRRQWRRLRVWCVLSVIRSRAYTSPLFSSPRCGSEVSHFINIYTSH
jgi:hypothetical protein